MTIDEFLAFLSEKDKITANSIHQNLIQLGYKPIIKRLAGKDERWKCEYSRSKNTLLIIRFESSMFSVNCKLDHIAEYSDLDKCTENVKKIIKSAGGCGSHANCKGPLNFKLDDNEYSKCRRGLVFKSLSHDDILCVINLLLIEDALISNKQNSG